MTAHAIGDAREECLRAGMDYFVSKPVKRETLRSLLTQWLSGSSFPLIEAVPESINDEQENALQEIENSIDLNFLLELDSIRSNGSSSLVNELISVFLNDVPDRFLALKNSLSNCDSDALEKSAHRLKGSCSQLGIVRMANLCESIEEKGNQGDFASVFAVVADLEREFKKVENWLTAKHWEKLR